MAVTCGQGEVALALGLRDKAVKATRCPRNWQGSKRSRHSASPLEFEIISRCESRRGAEGIDVIVEVGVRMICEERSDRAANGEIN